MALLSQGTLQRWREQDGLADFDWRRNGKLVVFRERGSFEHARTQTAAVSAQGLQPQRAHRPSAPRAGISITDYSGKIVYARIGQQLRVAAMVDIVGFDPSPAPARLALMRRQAEQTFAAAGDYQAANGPACAPQPPAACR